MKELNEIELSKLSRIERYKYYDELNEFKWLKKSFEDKDVEIKNTQEFYINRRGVEGVNLEEKLDIINKDVNSFDTLNFDLDLKYRNKEGSEKYTFFRETKSPFSQWYKTNFIGETSLIEGVSDLYQLKKEHILNNLFPFESQEYTSAEQFMMYHKAIIFLDRDMAEKIMKTNNVSKIKELGRNVKNFDENVWNYYRSKVVYEGNKAKFSQNPILKQELFKTRGTTLVESSPNDNIWGIGLHEEDKRVLKRENWLGKNLLGEILTIIRIELMHE